MGYGWEHLRGCDAPTVAPVCYWEGQPLYRCPRLIVPAWCWEVLSLWPMWEKGALPCSGGVLDQPAPLYHAMRIISNTVGRVRELKADTPDGAAPKDSSKGFRAHSPVRSSLRPQRR